MGVEILRKDFPEGIEGTIAYMRAFCAWKDARTSAANKAFSEAFTRALRAKA